MDKGIFIKVLLIILVILIGAIILGNIKIAINKKICDKGNILYEYNFDKFLYIINFILVGIILMQLMMSFRYRQYGGVVATIALVMINLNKRPCKFIITECGVGIADQFNGFCEFMEWDKIKSWRWSRFNKNVLSIENDPSYRIWTFKEFKIRADEIKNVDCILMEHCSLKSRDIVSK